jgi:hypothetical protein
LFTCAFTFVTSFDRSLVLTSDPSVLLVIATVDASTLLSDLADNSRKNVSKYFACWAVSSLTFSIVLASLLFSASNLLVSLSDSFVFSSFRLCFNASLLAWIRSIILCKGSWINELVSDWKVVPTFVVSLHLLPSLPACSLNLTRLDLLLSCLCEVQCHKLETVDHA